MISKAAEYFREDRKVAMENESHFPYQFIDKVIITEDAIKERVKALGETITRDYQDSEKLLLLGLLRGSVVFITDLMREIQPGHHHGLHVHFLL